MKAQHPVFCAVCGSRIAQVPVALLWTGSVNRIPEDPEDLGGLSYLPCERCKKQGRPQWQRYELLPPNPSIKIVVPVLLKESA